MKGRVSFIHAGVYGMWNLHYIGHSYGGLGQLKRDDLCRRGVESGGDPVPAPGVAPLEAGGFYYVQIKTVFNVMFLERS